MQIRSNLKNTIFTACKWCKWCKYYVNSMVISCSTCTKGEQECTLVKYVICAVLSRFQVVVIYAIFQPNPNSQIFIIDNKKRLLQLCFSANNFIGVFTLTTFIWLLYTDQFSLTADIYLTIFTESALRPILSLRCDIHLFVVDVSINLLTLFFREGWRPLVKYVLP